MTLAGTYILLEIFSQGLTLHTVEAESRNEITTASFHPWTLSNSWTCAGSHGSAEVRQLTSGKMVLFLHSLGQVPSRPGYLGQIYLHWIWVLE